MRFILFPPVWGTRTLTHCLSIPHITISIFSKTRHVSVPAVTAMTEVRCLMSRLLSMMIEYGQSVLSCQTIILILSMPLQQLSIIYLIKLKLLLIFTIFLAEKWKRLLIMNNRQVIIRLSGMPITKHPECITIRFFQATI